MQRRFYLIVGCFVLCLVASAFAFVMEILSANGLIVIVLALSAVFLLFLTRLFRVKRSASHEPSMPESRAKLVRARWLMGVVIAIYGVGLVAGVVQMVKVMRAHTGQPLTPFYVGIAVDVLMNGFFVYLFVVITRKLRGTVL